jgi:hypothetical protein
MKHYVITLAAVAAAFVGSNVGAQDSLDQLLNEVKTARSVSATISVRCFVKSRRSLPGKSREVTA